MPRGDRLAPAQALGRALLAFLLARAAVAGGLSPFAVAFAAAVLICSPAHVLPAAEPEEPPPLRRAGAQPAGRPRPALSMGALLALSAAAGAASRGDAAAALAQGVGVAAVWLLIRHARGRLGGGAAAAGAGALLARVLETRALDAGSLVLVAAATLLGGLLEAAFAVALQPRGDGERAAAGGLLAAAAVAGLSPLQLGPADLAAAGASVAALWLARNGPAAGAAGGSALGATALVVGALPPAGAVAVAAGGLAAGLLARYGRPAAALGCGACEALVAAGGVSGLGLLPTPGVVGGLAGVALAGVAPAAWWPAWPGVPAGPGRPERRLSDRLQKVAAAVAELGASVRQAAPAAAAAVPWSRPGPVDDVVGAVCHGCPAYTDCWDRKFMRAYRMVDDLLVLAESRPVRRSDVGGPETIDCLRPAEMARAINLRAELGARANRLAARLGEGRALVAAQMDGLVQVLQELAAEADGRAAAVPASPRRLRYEAATRNVPRRGRVASGDSHLVRDLGDGRVLLALSDGMGSGPAAALQSTLAVTLAERLLAGGFPRESTVRTVNAALLLREPEEAFATLDLAVINLAGGVGEFVKQGAPCAYHCRGGAIAAIAPGGPPAGAVAEPTVTVARREIEAGDEIVLLTDGVSQAGGEPDWVRSFLAGVPPESAEARAVEVLARAVELAGPDHDDMTAIVCRLHCV